MYAPVDENEEDIPKITNYKILKMKNQDFRYRLVTHFHKRWDLKDILWPSRTGEMTA